MANREEQLKQITEQLEQGVAEIFTSEKYTEYLNTMAKFHNYSFNNTLLIAMQKPEATLVAGYQAWQKKFNRQVKRGEKGIQIIAPAPYKERQEIEKTDPETGEIVIGEDGQPETEVVERVITRFRVTTVFDVSQTTGEPIPEFEVSELDGDVLIYHDFMESLKMVAPVPIRFIEIDGEAKGFYQLVDKYIAIQPGMSEAQTMKTAVHETAHAVLHDRDQMEAEGIVKDQLTREVEAESVAYVVCNHFGLDTSEYSFSYIASWSSGKNMKELRASMDTIRKTSADMIGQIEEKLKELQIERAEQEADVVEQTEEMSAMQYAEQTINRLEQERTIFSNDQRNLIVNFAYKLDDREAMEKLAENLAESILDGNREAVLKLIGEAEEQIESLPDSMIGLSELHEAGFYSESMLPLTRERAVELHHEGVTVYGLTGAVGGQEQSQRIMNLELDILQHDGLFGVTKFEWENYRRSQETIMTPEEKAKIKETLLLESDGKRYGIYQINSGQEERGYQFLSLETAKEMGFTVDGKDYQMVYSERLRDATTLDNLFERFNIERPNDFTGHSMSVSDVIIMNRGGRLTAYYVDSFGFTELPDFVAQRAEMLNDNPVKAYPEVYMGTLEKAMQERNVDAYLDSRKLNIDCKNAIEQAIAEGFDGMRLNPDVAVGVVEKYGEERVAFVLANTLKQLSYDGRFSDGNKRWADGIDIPENISRGIDLNRDYIVGSHPAVLNGFIDMARKEIRTRKLEEVLGVKNQHITETTRGYEADGHTGTWYAMGMKTYHGERFFQMRSEEYGQDVADIIVSENGTLVAEDIWHGFDEGAREAISEYLEENGATVYDLMNIPDQATVILADGTVMKIIKVDINPILEERITLAEYIKESEAYLDQQEIMKLAVDLDNFSYEYDTYEYKDTVENREEQVEKLTEDILNKETAGLKEWLTEVSEESDIDSDVVTARSLLSRLENAETFSVFTRQPEQEQPEATITFYVAECMEFPVMGEYHENLTLEEALRIYETIPADRMNGIKGVGFDLHDGSDYDGPYDLMRLGKVDREGVEMIQHYKESPLVQKAMDDVEKYFASKQEITKIEEKAVEDKSVPKENLPQPKSRKESVLQALRERQAKIKEQEQNTSKEKSKAHKKGDVTL